MRKVLYVLLGLFLFACSDDKDTMSLEEEKEDVLNTIIGRWQFSRMASDPEFKNLIEVEQTECNKGDYSEFNKDSTAIEHHCVDDHIFINKGSFEIGSNTGSSETPYLHTKFYIYTKGMGLSFGQQGGRSGRVDIYSYTKDTFIFCDYNEFGYKYYEFKRIPIPEE